MDNGSDARVDFNAILDIIAERIADKVLRHSETTNPLRPRLLTVAQAAVYLGRTETSIRHMASRGVLPTVRGDERIQFDIQDLDRWIDQNKVER